MFKKLHLFIALLLVPISFWAQTFTQANLTYTVISGTTNVSVKAVNSSVKSVAIPEFVTDSGTNYAVTSLENNAFYYCSDLTSVSIPNSVTSIGDTAFANCSSLTSVVIPNSVTSIGQGTFSSCEGLTSIVIPDSVTTIGDYAFEFTGLTSVSIGNSVKKF